MNDEEFGFGALGTSDTTNLPEEDIGDIEDVPWIPRALVVLPNISFKNGK